MGAVRKAVNENPEVLARFNGLRATDAQRSVVEAGRRPRLDLTANAGVESNSTASADYGGYATASSRLVFTQMLYDGGFNASEIERLGYSRLTRLYELQEISETIALETVRAYGDVLRHRDLVEAATDNYIEHRQTFLQVEERAKAGVGRRVDVEQANGRLALAESNLLTELTNLHDVSARYQRIVGERPPNTLPRLPEGFRFADLPASPVQVLNEGLSRNPGINASLENVRALRQAIASRQVARRPRVDFRAAQTLGQNTGGPPGSTRTTTAEAVLNFNLFDGGASSAQERQATFERDQARDLQEKVCRDTRQTLAIAYSDVNSLQLQLKYRDDHRLTTEKSREAYRQQFEIGQRSLLDLLDSQNEFFEATRSYINTRYNQIAAQARVLAGMGRLVETMGVARADMPTPQEFGQDRLGMDPAELCPIETTIVDTIERIKNDLTMPARRGMPAASAGEPPPSALLPSSSDESTDSLEKLALSPTPPTSPVTSAAPVGSSTRPAGLAQAGSTGSVTAPATDRRPPPSDASPPALALPVSPSGPTPVGTPLSETAPRSPAVRVGPPPPPSPGSIPGPATTAAPGSSDTINRAAWMSMAPLDPQNPPSNAPAADPASGGVGTPFAQGSSAVPTDAGSAQVGSQPGTGAATTPPATSAVTTPPPSAVMDARTEVLAALRDWAKAWSERNMQAYAAAYAPDFKGSARTREDWLKQRTARIVPRQRIEVELEDEVVSIDGDAARVHFRQHYRSDSVQDIERRAVRMQRIDGRWLITQESRR